jgi:light-regulated signal transduction histidine kinase (bacteriophytochrome)
VPMLAGGRSLGTLTFVTSESGRHYTDSHLRTAEELGRRAASALENARLYKESQNAQEELRRNNAELARANEDLNQFAYSASHDLREPLRMIAIYGQILHLRCEGKLDEDGTRALGFMLDGVRRMEALLRDILAYTQAANRVEETGSSDAAVALARALENLQSAIDSSGAVIEAGELPVLPVPEGQLTQLFQNLAGNAIKYRGNLAPRVQIRAKRDRDGWVLSVADNGIGIAPEYKDQVFGLFKRLHTADEHAGTGVGLAICQKIVQRNGGTIWVESEPGCGATFFFRIPVPPEAQGPPPGSASG